MGLQDRPYWRRDEPAPPGLGGVRLGLPKPTQAVKTLLIVNLTVFVVQIFADAPQQGRPMRAALGVTITGFWQLWRYLTFQFLHGDFWHVMLNMLGVYFLGTPLERSWGTRRFVVFYLTCGATAGVAYVLVGAAFGLPGWLPIIGASGGVFGILLACAVLFPQFMIIFLFFPVPIRLAAVILFAGMGLLVAQAAAQGTAQGKWAAMSDVAHLGGALAAAVWVWVLPRVRRARAHRSAKARRGAWDRRMKSLAEEQAEIDRILQKIHDEGLASLTKKEKRTLQDATQRQRSRERELYRL